MWPRRVARVNELLLREISRYVLENQTPSMGFVTFLAVEVTEDLETAKVFYSVLGSDEEKARTAQELERMRHDLIQDMRKLESLKRLPELFFLLDDTPVKAARVHELLEVLKEPEPPPAPRRRTRKKSE